MLTGLLYISSVKLEATSFGGLVLLDVIICVYEEKPPCTGDTLV